VSSTFTLNASSMPNCRPTLAIRREPRPALGDAADARAAGEFPLLAQAGFLLSYGADLDVLGRRAVALVDKVLKGARRGNLAIERPTKFQLVLNRKTAKSIGLALPQSLLLRAGEAIQ
jgi:ABC transporter substrate binding protein